MLGKISVSLLLFGLITGCQTTAVNTSFNSNYQHYDKNGLPINPNASDQSANNDLWELTRRHLKFTDSYNKARVVNEINYFNRYPLHMTKVSQQALPYYYFVLQEVLKRDLPSEVALVPIIESLYDPTAYSQGKASGIWQFIPSTATYLGIEINDWYDGRRDVITSTNTALDYLSQLNKRFDGDWMLTFAAYNSGGGTVSKAIRKNREKGLPTDYWSIKLPKETTKYVPRILAIAALINTPSQFNIKLPSIANEPYFKEVKLKGQTDLNKIAALASISNEVIQQLNPGFNRNVTAPSGPHRILVPIHKADKLQLAINNLKKTERLNWSQYRVVAGDSLGKIAQQYGVSTAVIKSANALTSSRIKIGATLLIPSYASSKIQQQVAKSHKTHQINDGDTVWDIAKKHKLSVNEILAFNGLSKSSTLRIGSSIKIPRG